MEVDGGDEEEVEVDGGDERAEKEEGPCHPPWNVFFFCLSSFFFFGLLFLSLGTCGKRDMGEPRFDSRAPHGIAEECWSGTGPWSYTQKSTTTTTTTITPRADSLPSVVPRSTNR